MTKRKEEDQDREAALDEIFKVINAAAAAAAAQDHDQDQASERAAAEETGIPDFDDMGFLRGYKPPSDPRDV